MSGNMGSRVAGATVWNFSTRIAVKSVGLVSTVILARILVPEDFAFVAIAMSVLAIVEAATNMSVSSALVIQKNVTEDHWNTAWTMNMLRGVVIALAVYGISGPVGQFYGDDAYSDAIAILALMPLIGGLQSARFVQFEKDLSMRQSFIMEVCAKFSAVVVSITLAIILENFWAIIFGQMSAGVVKTAITYVYCPFLPRPTLARFKEIFGFTSWLTASNVVHAVNTHADNFMVGALLSKASLGTYRVGQDLVQMLTSELILPLTKSLFPAFSLVQDEPERMRRMYLEVQAIVVMVALPVGFGLAFVARPLVLLVLGEKWIDGAIVVQFLAPVLSLQMLAAGIMSLVMAQGHTNKIFYRNFIYTSVRLPAMFAGLFYYGIVGLLIARVFTGLFQLGLNLYMAQSAVKVSFTDLLRKTWRSWVSCAAMVVFLISIGAFVSAPYYLMLPMQVLPGALVYVLAHFLLWHLSGRKEGPEMKIFTMCQRIFNSKFGSSRNI